MSGDTPQTGGITESWDSHLDRRLWAATLMRDVEKAEAAMRAAAFSARHLKNLEARGTTYRSPRP